MIEQVILTKSEWDAIQKKLELAKRSEDQIRDHIDKEYTKYKQWFLEHTDASNKLNEAFYNKYNGLIDNILHRRMVFTRFFKRNRTQNKIYDYFTKDLL